MTRRIVSLWFPRLASDRALRVRPVAGPFALTLRQSNTERIHSATALAEAEGVAPGMGFADARALCPELVTAPADPASDQRFLARLAHWATRFCPWVGLEGTDGLVLDVTGSAHLFGGEAALLDAARARLGRAGLSVRTGLADTRGAAWALARFAEGIAPPGKTAAHLAPLPVAALRLDGRTAEGLERLGLGTIGALAALPRANLARRFGPATLARLDQAMGEMPEEISPLPEPPSFAARITLPDPIGLTRDVTAGIERLLARVTARLEQAQRGARTLTLTVRRVDQAASQVELRLARPMRDAARLAALFAPHVEKIDAGFGIDQLRLEATATAPLPATQTTRHTAETPDRLADLITRLGNRAGLERILRFLPADSHIPERAYVTAPAAFTEPCHSWPTPRPRPLRMFPPEPIAATGPRPPTHFRWRAMRLTTARATGPERLSPEWWHDDPNWRTGLRDYWRIETHQGRRLWLFHTPQTPGWFVHGEFA